MPDTKDKTDKNGGFSFSNFYKELKKGQKGVDDINKFQAGLDLNPADLGLSESRATLENGLNAGLSGLSTGLALSASSIGALSAAAGPIGIGVAAAIFAIGASKRRKAKKAEHRRKVEAVRRARQRYFAQIEQKKDVLEEHGKKLTKFKESGQIEKQVSAVRTNVKQALASSSTGFGGASLQAQARGSGELESLDFLLDQSTDRLAGQIEATAELETLLQSELDAERGEFEVSTNRLETIKQKFEEYDETY